MYAYERVREGRNEVVQRNLHLSDARLFSELGSSSFPKPVDSSHMVFDVHRSSRCLCGFFEAPDPEWKKRSFSVLRA